MRSITSACRGICTIMQLLLVSGCTATGASNLYIAGYIKHAEPTPKTNEGNMRFIGYSRDYEKGDWNFETGASTYVDSYHKRSYMIFSNVSHDDYKTRYVTPALVLNCAYKGNSYVKDSMKLICVPPVSLKIGPDHGFFGYLTPVPKVGTLTNGFISVIVGYKFAP